MQKENLLLEKKLTNKEKDIKSFKMVNSEQSIKIKGLEAQILTLKKNLLVSEKEISLYKEETQKFDMKIEREKSLNQSMLFKCEIYEKQLNSLINSLAKSDSNYEKLLLEKKSIMNNKIIEFLNKNNATDFCDYNVNQYYFNNDYNLEVIFFN